MGPQLGSRRKRTDVPGHLTVRSKAHFYHVMKRFAQKLLKYQRLLPAEERSIVEIKGFSSGILQTKC